MSLTCFKNGSNNETVSTFYGVYSIVWSDTGKYYRIQKVENALFKLEKEYNLILSRHFKSIDYTKAEFEQVHQNLLKCVA